MRHIQQFLGHAVDPLVCSDFATGRAEARFAGEGNQPLLITVGADIASITMVRIAATHHLFDDFLHVDALVGREVLPVIIPPPFPLVAEDLAKAVGAVLRWRTRILFRSYYNSRSRLSKNHRILA
jgi:hypothetical protein